MLLSRLEDSKRLERCLEAPVSDEKQRETRQLATDTAYINKDWNRRPGGGGRQSAMAGRLAPAPEVIVMA